MTKYFAPLIALILAIPAFAIERNVASQRLEVQEIDSATGAPKTGDAAQLTAYESIDGGTLTALTDTSATESSATNAPGVYWFDLSQAETNGTNILYSGKSSTSGCYIIPRMVATVPGGFSTLTIASNAVNSDAKKINGVATTSVTTINANVGTTQPVNFTGTSTTAYVKTDAIDLAGTALTGRDIGASVLLSSGTGTGQLNFTSGVVQADAAKAGGTTWGSGAITAASVSAAAASKIADSDARYLGNFLWSNTPPTTTITLGSSLGSGYIGARVLLLITDSGTGFTYVATGVITGATAITTDSNAPGAGGGDVSAVRIYLIPGDDYAIVSNGTYGLSAAHTERAAIKTKTDFLPSATAGAAGGVFIAGTNAATTITTGLTTHFIGTVDTVTSVTGAVGSVTGGVGGSVGSVSGVTFPTNFGSLSIDGSGRVDIGKILGTASAGTAGYMGPDWSHINAPTTTVNLSATTFGAVTSVSDKTGYRLSSTGVGDIWNEVQSGHTTAGTFGKYLDSAVSGVSTGGLTAGDIANAVWDALRSAHTTSGTYGQGVASVTGSVGSISGITYPTNFSALAISGGGAVTAGTVSDKTGYSLTQTFPANFSALGIGAGGHITNVDTITTYTGDTPQTGDAYARIGANGAGLTAVGDTAGTTTLLSRLSSARAGYLDNINNAALQTTVAQTGDSFARIGATGSGLSSLAPASTALSTAVWTNTKAGYLDAAISSIGPGGLTTGDIATAVWANAGRTLTSAANITSTGGTTIPQTGDAFARLGSNGAGLTALSTQTSVNAISTVLGTPAHTTIAGDIANVSGGGSGGGPFLQRKVGPAHILTARDGGDGNFGVIGTLHQQKGTGPITWAVELAGTQIPAGATIDSMSAPVLSGADSGHASIGTVASVSYGTNNTRLLFEFTLGGSATTTDAINITIPFAPNAGESNSIVIPVTVNN